MAPTYNNAAMMNRPNQPVNRPRKPVNRPPRLNDGPEPTELTEEE